MEKKKRGPKVMTGKKFRWKHERIINMLHADIDIRVIAAKTGYSTQYVYKILNDPRSGLERR